MAPQYISFSNIIIDDIVLWDERTFMGTLGGSGTHALIGMRIWSEQLGCVATVGPDFDPAQRQQLLDLGSDLSGVVEHADYQTARAWQIFEPDERRIEIMRTDPDAFHAHVPYFSDVPEEYYQARGVHIQWGPSFDELNQLLDQWRSVNPNVCLVWEPALEYLNGDAHEFGGTLKRLDLFSPDIDQAQAMTNLTDPIDMARALLSWGTPRVAIRMGAEGSVVATAQGEAWHIPAVPPKALVDVTGAGNAYCGGCAAGLGQGLSTLEAVLHGAVSASFAIEQFGVPHFDASTMDEAKRRLKWARQHVAVF